MFKSVVYQGNCLLGEAEIYPQNPSNVTWMNREIRISHFSPPSDRCPPLAVLHTIATAGVCFRMESKPPQFSDDSPMFRLHTTCLRENKTAVVSLGDMELHLVAMPSRKMIDKNSCFWGFNIARGLYYSCIIMMNLRCLGIVFDLDETLIVANTMRSFEDRIDALQRKINSESDPSRVSGMLAEVKRYQDDKSILKQYAETDQVFENGKVYKVQSEVVPPFSDGQQPIIRPLIRLQEKNIILTRVNPGIRDTSVLVRVRPAWEELRSYLTAKGRKRFEVYVCTMAERDYALEMWRLLDPESNLINSSQLLDRIVCVKSGLKKSLLNVFQNAICHPRMALVIDDRLKVWDDRDQPRVHVVPAYAPYYAPQAETNNAVPVLHVARNVACNVRGNFFKEFDEGLLPRVSEVCFEDDMTNFPSAPDVGNYLITEDDTCALNGNKESLVIEGVIDVEAGRRLKETGLQSSFPVVINNFDPRLVPCLPHAVPTPSMASQAAPPAMLPIHKNHYPQSQSAAPTKLVGHSGISDTIVQSSPAREEGEVPESELDPDTRRRLLILQHGQDIRDHIAADPPLPPARPPLQGPVPTPQGSWVPMEGEMSPRQLPPKEYPLEPEGFHYEKKRSNNSSFFRGIENSTRTDRPFRENQRFPKKAYRADHRLGVNRSSPDNYDSFPADEMPSRMSSNKRDTHFESKRSTLQYPETPAAVLEEIASKCGAKVEYKTTLVDTRELQFSVQVLFIGEKVSEGICKTRKEAQRQAAEDALMILANKYISNAAPDPGAPTHGDLDKLGHPRENGFGIESNCLRYSTHEKDDILPNSNTLENSQYSDSRLTSKTSFSDLKELCTLEGLDLVFQPRPSMTTDLANEGEIHVQAEVDGQVLGKGTGMTWEEAKLQASEEALMNLKSSIDQVAQKHAASPRSWHMPSNKRLKAEFSQSFPRTHSSRYS